MLRVTVPPDVQAVLRSALARAKSRECGGILMGEHVGHNHFVVRSVTVQATGGFAWFVRGVSSAVNAVRKFLASNGNDYRRFNYLGEWHSHPSFSVMPSATDNETMREMARTTAGATFLVLLIFRLDGTSLIGSAHTYLPDGAVHLSTLDLES